ncbi:MAG: hypothetical protein J0M19_07085 [Sphingomonadales bacterium]|nr:hypothetical protein [Sphingomonadales bacterium]
MMTLMALLLVSGTPGLAGDEPVPTQARISARATAEILRADTSSPETPDGGARRQVRQRPGRYVTVEFE